MPAWQLSADSIRPWNVNASQYFYAAHSPLSSALPESINNMRINKEYKKHLKDNRLLFLSPFDENQRRISAKRAHYRNLFVAAMSAVIFVAHAGSGSKTESFCKEILSWQKPIYTFESNYNKNGSSLF